MVDRLGWGSSQGLEVPTSFEGQARALFPLLPDGRVDVFGWRNGGLIALELAPERVSRVLAREPPFAASGGSVEPERRQQAGRLTR